MCTHSRDISALIALISALIDEERPQTPRSAAKGPRAIGLYGWPQRRTVGLAEGWRIGAGSGLGGRREGDGPSVERTRPATARPRRAGARFAGDRARAATQYEAAATECAHVGGAVRGPGVAPRPLACRAGRPGAAGPDGARLLPGGRRRGPLGRDRIAFACHRGTSDR